MNRAKSVVRFAQFANRTRCYDIALCRGSRSIDIHENGDAWIKCRVRYNISLIIIRAESKCSIVKFRTWMWIRTEPENDVNSVYVFQKPLVEYSVSNEFSVSQTAAAIVSRWLNCKGPLDLQSEDAAEERPWRVHLGVSFSWRTQLKNASEGSIF